MKIEIQNLGPIHHFEFDLEKDLHLLYGENNVGKSFAVNVVYCFLKGFLDVPENFITLFGTHNLKKVIDEKVIEGLDKSGKIAADVTSKVEEGALYLFENSILKNIRRFLFNTYSRNGKIDNTMSSGNFSICFSTRTYSLSFQNSKNNELSIVNFKTKDKIELKYDPKAVFQSIDIYKNNKKYESNTIGTTNGAVIRLAFYDFLSEVRRTHDYLLFLPASRSGLYQALQGFGEIFAELSKYRFQVKKEVRIPPLSEPVADYFLQLSSLKKVEKETAFSKLARKVEEKIMGGKILFEEDTKQIFFQSRNKKLTIGLNEASSMIAEIAPLVLFLRYAFLNELERLTEDDFPLLSVDKLSKMASLEDRDDLQYLLFIEEPEAHLHPKVQVQLMEIFAELTKHNVKVILTSHSNYMFNKLSNMLLKKEMAPEKVAVYHMVMTDEGSVVSPDMQATAEGIEDHNFAGVAQKLYQERLESYEILNEEGDAYK